MDNPTDEITIRIINFSLDNLSKNFSEESIGFELNEILKKSIHYGLTEWKEMYLSCLLILGACLKSVNASAYKAFIDFVFDDEDYEKKEIAEEGIQEIVNNIKV
jgi:hypothetical protein